MLEGVSFRDILPYIEGKPELLRWAKNNKIVVDASEDELSAVLSENTVAMQNSDELYRVIMPTAQCSLGCTYCGQFHSPNKIDALTAASILSDIEENLGTEKYRYLKVGWFGAEPLQNLPGVRSLTQQLMQTSARHNVHYSAKMATNGLKLTGEVASELIHELSVMRLDVTLDGPAHVHDSRRFSKGGKGTFEAILGNLKSVASIRPPPGVVTVRCNVDHTNADSVEELLLILGEQGWGDAISVYFAPVHAWGDFSPQRTDSSWLAEKEIEWRYLARHLGIPVADLPARKYITCMATNKHARLYDPNGKSHSCTELPLAARETSGNAIDYDFRSFSDAIERHEVPCWQCKMLPVCGGACPKQWADGNVPCPTFKFNAHQLLLQELCRGNV
ncbi:radical SAM protein [Ensifer psoraleae]|uniref:Radical SAM protein n=1 Tax=Sinorhizobium psoraleae TaxID=520838 RepID=A0ABT4KGX9_9HYPH|nr:radical SAM protein [Sinorhizobium psoraleae]